MGCGAGPGSEVHVLPPSLLPPWPQVESCGGKNTGSPDAPSGQAAWDRLLVPPDPQGLRPQSLICETRGLSQMAEAPPHPCFPQVPGRRHMSAELSPKVQAGVAWRHSVKLAGGYVNLSESLWLAVYEPVVKCPISGGHLVCNCLGWDWVESWSPKEVAKRWPERRHTPERGSQNSSLGGGGCPRWGRPGWQRVLGCWARLCRLLPGQQRWLG